METRKHVRKLLCAAIAAAIGITTSLPVHAANHREAPLTALDHKADITDFFAFVSYDNRDKVTFILNVDPLLEPANGPNYFPFDPEIVYAIRVDNDHDAIEDTVVEVRFRTEIRAPGVFTGFVGAGNGVNAPGNAPPDLKGNATVGKTVVPRAITAIDGPGSEGLSLRQSYSFTIKQRIGGQLKTVYSCDRDRYGRKLFAVPSNVGPRTMPNYDNDIARKGIYDLEGGIRVFAGTVDDPFWIDLGAVFDSVSFRQPIGGGLGVLSPTQDANDTTNFAPDDVSGYNVNAIAIEVPLRYATRGGRRYTADQADAVIGAWGTTSRPKSKFYSSRPGERATLSPELTQIQRMGNPLINEVIIGTGDKDKFSMSRPRDDAQFASYALDPLLARVLNAVTGGALPIPAPPRVDLLPLVQYLAPICPGCTTPETQGPVADMLRLNTAIPPTTPSKRSRLGALAGDLGGFPNGRRVSDDVTDIATRAVAGVLNPSFNAAPNNLLGDGVNANDRAYQETFPYLAFANSGRNSRHVDPTESGCTGVCPQN